MPKTTNAAESPEGPNGWNEWYAFAKDELGYGHEERVDYANHRYVEEQNRESLQKREGERLNGR